jgi:hypothetical protein
MIEINNLRVQRNGRDALKVASLEIKKAKRLLSSGQMEQGKVHCCLRWHI